MPSPSRVVDLVSFRTVAHWVRAAALCDIDLGSILRREGAEGLLSQPHAAEIERARLERLMQQCVEATWARQAGQHFPLVLADTFAFEYMPDMEMFVSSAPTLRDAAKVLDLVSVFFDPALSLRLTEMGSQARLLLRYTQPGERVEASAPFVEAAFALCLKLSRILQGQVDVSSRISFRHQRHQGHEACVAFFGVPIDYGQPVDALCFDRAALDRRLRGAMEVAHTSSAQRLQDHVEQRQGARQEAPARGLVAWLTQRLVCEPALVLGDLAALAEQLALHPRTLQRRLKAEGSSYSEVLDKARFELADQWLKSEKSLTVEELAVRLGFADRTGFTQAFARWTGMTPAQYRSR